MEGYNKKSLTVGSIDIGAGTTDIMIAAYKYDDARQCTLTPVPLFWESFYRAGDDLLKELIHQCVVEGKYSPIENKLKSLGKSQNQIIELNNDFFGGDNGMSFHNRQLRIDFNLQISVSIINYYLELFKENIIESKIFSFNDIFKNNMPTRCLLDHFKKHFDFDFETLQWHYEKNIIAAIIENTFDTLIGKISSLLSFYDCDIILLSGRPTSLKTIPDLFLKYYAIAPNRLKTLNDYRVGRWYPEDKRYKFLDGNGYLNNPKSIVAIGAMIGASASNGGLDGFSLNLQELIVKQSPTTEYFGKLNEQTLEFIETIISPDNNYSLIEVSSLPVRIGTRQLDTQSYPSRPFYTLNYNYEKIEDRAKGRIDDENDLNAIQGEIGKEIVKIRSKMPLKISFERNYNEDKEFLCISSVSDCNGDDVSISFFNLQVQSMSELENFWLDSGVFGLNINKSNN